MNQTRTESGLTASLMRELISAVCKYLNIDENLLGDGCKSRRVVEARKLISYGAVVKMKIPRTHVRKFIGVEHYETITNYVLNVRCGLKNDNQLNHDVKFLIKVCEEILPVLEYKKLSKV